MPNSKRPWQILCLNPTDAGASFVAATYSTEQAARAALPAVRKRLVAAAKGNADLEYVVRRRV